jgi:glycosyltransferase involved in cell wall biosynthesis
VINSSPHNLAVVVIGRNEGERLAQCLRSILKSVDAVRVVYVDSGSTDGSPDLARSIGVRVVALTTESPFTAARARNAGFACFDENTEWVQFIDGDCELVEGWLNCAMEMTQRSNLAVICGRRRERFPEATVFNRLCDIEWNTPIGEADACGGDALIRSAALRQISGYDASLLAGEDPEMCARLRKAGWKIERIDADMTLHDAAMTWLSQWWRRMVRAGHAYAEVNARHGGPPLRMWMKETRSNWFWGLALPLLALALAWPTRGISVGVAALGYLLLWAKILRSSRSSEYARYTTLAKFPLACGQAWYWLNRLRGRRARIIEYKQPARA